VHPKQYIPNLLKNDKKPITGFHNQTSVLGSSNEVFCLKHIHWHTVKSFSDVGLNPPPNLLVHAATLKADTIVNHKKVINMCKFTRSSLKQGRKKEPNNHCEKLGHLSSKNMRNRYGGLLWK
jgi:hypothetical protein